MQKKPYRQVVIFKISLGKVKEAHVLKRLWANDPIFHPGCQTKAILCVGLIVFQKLVLVRGPCYRFSSRAPSLLCNGELHSHHLSQQLNTLWGGFVPRDVLEIGSEMESNTWGIGDSKGGKSQEHEKKPVFQQILWLQEAGWTLQAGRLMVFSYRAFPIGNSG